MKIKKRKPLEAGVVIECHTPAEAAELRAALNWMKAVSVTIREGRIVCFRLSVDRLCAFGLVLSPVLQKLGIR